MSKHTRARARTHTHTHSVAHTVTQCRERSAPPNHTYNTYKQTHTPNVTHTGTTQTRARARAHTHTHTHPICPDRSKQVLQTMQMSSSSQTITGSHSPLLQVRGSGTRSSRPPLSERTSSTTQCAHRLSPYLQIFCSSSSSNGRERSRCKDCGGTSIY